MSMAEAVASGTVANEYVAYYLALTHEFLCRVGVAPDRLRFRQHLPDERAHYACDCWDAECLSGRFGWVETVGIADRTDYDLRAHAAHSGEPFTVFIQYAEPVRRRETRVVPNMGALGPRFRGQAKAVADAIAATDPTTAADPAGFTVEVDGAAVAVTPDLYEVREVEVEVQGEDVMPHVIEPSYGIDRILYAVLEHSFDEEPVDDGTRTVLRLAPGIAPIQVAVFPLMTRDGLARGRDVDRGRARRPPGSWPSTTTRARSAGGTVARTRSAPRSRSRSTTTPSRTGPSPCAIATRCGRSAFPAPPSRRPAARSARAVPASPSSNEPDPAPADPPGALEARQYQLAIAMRALDQNTMVVLPTGLGKTAVALLVAAARLKEDGAARVLMLAPTKPLAEQHYRFFRDFLVLPGGDDAFALFTGETPPAERVRGWERARICFATPQVIKNDCLAGRYSLEDVALLVVDECHRAVGQLRLHLPRRVVREDGRAVPWSSP